MLIEYRSAKPLLIDFIHWLLERTQTQLFVSSSWIRKGNISSDVSGIFYWCRFVSCRKGEELNKPRIENKRMSPGILRDTDVNVLFFKYYILIYSIHFLHLCFERPSISINIIDCPYLFCLDFQIFYLKLIISYFCSQTQILFEVKAQTVKRNLCCPLFFLYFLLLHCKMVLK